MNCVTPVVEVFSICSILQYHFSMFYYNSMYVCMCVCMYACMYVCICAYMSTCLNTSSLLLERTQGMYHVRLQACLTDYRSLGCNSVPYGIYLPTFRTHLTTLYLLSVQQLSFCIWTPCCEAKAAFSS